ncbi:hypothetical protein EUGRSUZ_G00498 [Eucalyptus grandis]|uniref:Uncharacterized protein n=2 Tax=Eucalyptus grandis TaxID=71139 RepID=A0ACC3K448_EUCGR|nr:hypothetical protein EUGRSUZ_G00498 [Eucalyptus grandis]
MDRAFNQLVYEGRKRNRITSTFNKVGWNNIRAEFIKQSRYQYNLLQLKNNVNKLRRRYGSFKKLILQSSFGWENVNKTIVVNNPSIWDSHINACFKFRSF